MNWTRKAVEDLQKAAGDVKEAAPGSRQEEVSGAVPRAQPRLDMNGLLTDLYELTMAAGYFEAGKADGEGHLRVVRPAAAADTAISCWRRDLPQAVEYLLNLSFTDEEIDYLRALPHSRSVSAGFFDYLRDFRFTGDLFAVPGGHAAVRRRAVPDRARAADRGADSRNVSALGDHVSDPDRHQGGAHGGGRAAGARWSSSERAGRTRRRRGCWRARAAYIGGCTGTSNTLAGFRYGIPVLGTAAHSWVMSFCQRDGGLPAVAAVLGDATVQLIDTYDTLEGARRAAKLGRPLWGVRLDSGDLRALARRCAPILDEAGLQRREDHGQRRPGRIPDPRTASPPARRSTPSASARNWPPRPTRPTWAPSTSWWNWTSAASSASPPSSARIRPSLPGRQADLSATRSTTCWRARASAAGARRCCAP